MVLVEKKCSLEQATGIPGSSRLKLSYILFSSQQQGSRERKTCYRLTKRDLRVGAPVLEEKKINIECVYM